MREEHAASAGHWATTLPISPENVQLTGEKAGFARARATRRDALGCDARRAVWTLVRAHASRERRREVPTAPRAVRLKPRATRLVHVTVCDVGFDPSGELERIYAELREPCDVLIALHGELAQALRDGDAKAVRRLVVQVECARMVCATLACGLSARLGGYFDELARQRS